MANAEHPLTRQHHQTHRVAALAVGAMALAALACRSRAEPGAAATGGGIRILSWNVSSDAFVRDPAAFRALVLRAQPDLLLLDEAAPTTSAQQIRDALGGLDSTGGNAWHVDVGESGGRQRGVIVSRMPLERLPEFAVIVPYPADERRRIEDGMTPADRDRPEFTMEHGIPVNGVLVRAGTRRLLAVVTDLQCCGGDPGSWQEYRRRVETAEVRRRVRQVLERTRVDGIIVAGDFNLISTALPLVIASGPYAAPHAGLIAAELRHLDGVETWTIDNRGRYAFPNAELDFLLYSPRSLGLREGYIFDSADLAPAELERLGLEPESANRLSDHRPLVAEFVWQ